ncbi:hypothetical protein ABIB25_002739 [Nakamurella sp. UYEF19]
MKTLDVVVELGRQEQSRAMAEERRVVVLIRPNHLYG